MDLDTMNFGFNRLNQEVDNLIEQWIMSVDAKFIRQVAVTSWDFKYSHKK